MTFKQLIAWLCSLFLLCASLPTQAATTPALDPAGGRVEDRQQLRVLLDDMEKGISNLDIDALLKLTQPNVVITWQNAEVSRGHDQIRAYYNRMLKGGAPIVRKFSTKAALGGPAVFYGESAVAFGTNVDRYELADGLAFTLNANWSTTIVKVDGQWKVAALHFSTNLFDNAMLDAAKKFSWTLAGGALLLGMVLGLIGMRMVRRKV